MTLDLPGGQRECVQEHNWRVRSENIYRARLAARGWVRGAAGKPILVMSSGAHIMQGDREHDSQGSAVYHPPRPQGGVELQLGQAGPWGW